MTNTFKKGEFQSYTAVTKVHLGSLETDLLKGETVQFDGITMKRGNDEHDIAVLVAAIRVGWLVPEGTTGSYSPLPADIKVHSATNRSDTNAVRLKVDIQDEERDMGTISEVRAPGSPPVHVASSAGKLSKGAPTGAAQYNDEEGKVVGRMRSAAKSAPIKLDGSDRKVVSQLDNSGRKIVDLVANEAVATGDVAEARSADNLAELLPNAAAAQAPLLSSQTDGEGRGDESELRARAVTAKGSSSVGYAEEGEVIRTVSTPTAEAPIAEIPATEVEAAVREAKLEVVRQFVPGFDWDLSVNWNRRAKTAVEMYGNNLPVLNAILSIETDAVRKGILKRLYQD